MQSKLGVVLLGVLIFLLGGIAGGICHFLYCEKIETKPAAPRTIRKVEDVAEDMARVLNLDAAQKAQVQAAIAEGRNSYRELWQRFRPQYETIVQESDNRIRSLLREDQKPLFEEYLRKIKSKPSATAKSANAK